jgi:hypothetical protein
MLLLERKETAAALHTTTINNKCKEEEGSPTSSMAAPPSSESNHGPLPSPGTPISILEFAELSSSEQKQWLNSTKTSATTRSKKRSSYNNTGTKESHCSSELHILASSFLDSSTASVGSSNETDCSLSSVSSAASLFEDEGETCGSARSSKSVQRSIFAPYWEKQAGARSSFASLPEAEEKDENPSRSTALVLPTSTTSQEQATTTTSPPPCPRRSIFGLDAQSPQVKSKRRVLEIASLAPRFVHITEQLVLTSTTHKKKARSASALLDRPKKASSILRSKEEEEGEPRRQRRHSFSVTFDSKVDVVLFNDPPALCQSSPWWLRLVGGGGSTSTSGDEEDAPLKGRSRRRSYTSSKKTSYPLLPGGDSF